MKVFNPEKELRKIQKGNKNKIILFVVLLLIVSVVSYSFALYQVRYSKRIIYTKVAPFSTSDLDLAVYVNGVNQSSVPTKESGYAYVGIRCDDGTPFAEWDEEKWNFKQISNINVPNKCNVYFVNDSYFIGSDTYECVKDIQQFIAPKTGLYLLEAWGAQGGSASSSIGGYGGYTRGVISLTEKSVLYVVVGGKGLQGTAVRQNLAGGYNGGGTSNVNTVDTFFGSGGGATHIATQSGLLSELNNNRESILVVAGGGGGAGWYSAIRNGGNAGGYIGSNGTGGQGGSQTAGGQGVANGSFGLGGGPVNGSGGGAGYFGGGTGYTYGASAGGGSSYISSKLMSAVMYCYSCAISNDFLTKTISITNVSDEPKARNAKIGDGYARITYLGE